MNNKHGFTLIELLAVIAILGIIVTITVPVISNLIADSRAKTFKNSVYELVNLVERDYIEFGRSGSVVYTFGNDKLTCPVCTTEIKFNGSIKNGSGTLTNTNGKITGKITDGINTENISQ